ncbi:hypothetical protein UFOVP274_62 [uncultured Caudovirales phage]|uniref:Uncharacterized protein n=1 Tax=uncultured Caudovirales phage TaxID=2100421 RepID=A0A6J5LKQ6_9CAUD|nr:hypothetical protein UFOVP274_62 [uncultured Caudovirales phage]
MSDEDKEALEALYAGFAMIGMVIKGVHSADIPLLSKELAKEMMKSEEGLEGIYKVRKRK